MAQVLPFQGYLYNIEKVGDLSKVLSLPYDKIPSQLREKYLERSPYHFVRLIRPENYERARQLWRDWRDKDIFIQDRKPSFYVYQQEFTLPSGISKKRTGCVGIVELKEFGNGIYPHEITFPGPKEDRFQLLKATHANLGQIFMIYRDSQQKISPLLEEAASTAPFISVYMEDLGETHRLWKIQDPAKVQEISRAFQNLPLYIADGHHRYETALSFYQSQLQKAKSPEQVRPYGYRMATLVNIQDPGLVILPTHRMIRLLRRLSSQEIKEKLSPYFSFHSVASLQEGEIWLEQKQEKIKEDQKRVKLRFILVLPGERLGLEWKDPAKLGEFGLSEIFWEVPVAVLHKIVLESLLEHHSSQRDEGHDIGFARSSEEVVEKVEKGVYSLGFLVPSLSIEAFQKVTSHGERLPQKSTDFYPKMLSGMTIYSMEDSFP
ncbi:MAG: DUF1015 domain-containing protein, partial [Planctomycetota bacterium]